MDLNIRDVIYVSNMCYFYAPAKHSYISGAKQSCKDVDSRAELAEIRHTSTQDEIGGWIQRISASAAYYRVGGHYNPGWSEDTNNFNEVKWNGGDWEPTQFSWYPSYPKCRYNDNTYYQLTSLFLYVPKDSSSKNIGMKNSLETGHGSIASLCQVDLSSSPVSSGRRG
jgi:hypothetical protein